jgi:flagellar capping protein FliD
MSELSAKQMALESQKADYERLSVEAAQRRDELEDAKKDLNKRVELMSQEFLRQQSIMDEQMRRIQNEKHELKIELENMANKSRQQAA